jgi:CheY-like chemotaxis protein
VIPLYPSIVFHRPDEQADRHRVGSQSHREGQSRPYDAKKQAWSLVDLTGMADLLGIRRVKPSRGCYYTRVSYSAPNTWRNIAVRAITPRQGLRLSASRKENALAKPPVIVIIDDDASVRATTDSLLRSLGYVSRTFASAKDFLRSNHRNDIACVIADVQMPSMSGVELQNHLIARGYRIPFIFITAFPDERTHAQVLRAGAVGYLTKPFTESSLIEGLNAALKGHGAGDSE